MIYCTCYIQPQLGGELAQNVTGPGQRTKRDSFHVNKVSLPKVVEGIRMAIDIPDPLRQVLDSRQFTNSYQRPWPLASLVSALVASMVYKFTWTSASSFFFCALACTFTSFLHFVLLFLRRWH